MEPNQKFAAVGVFLIGGIVTLVGLSVWLQKSFADHDKACYVMRFDDSVAGLSQGSPITFRGVGVGNVESIRINPHDDRQIMVKAALEKNTPIHPGTIAQLKPQGITGASYIELDINDKETRSGQPAPEGDCKLIATAPSGIEQIFNRLPQILDNTLAVTERLQRLMSDDNLSHVSSTLANLNRFSTSLSNDDVTVTNLQDTLHQAQTTLTEIKDLTTSLRADPKRLLLTPKVNEVKVP